MPKFLHFIPLQPYTHRWPMCIFLWHQREGSYFFVKGGSFSVDFDFVAMNTVLWEQYFHKEHITRLTGGASTHTPPITSKLYGSNASSKSLGYFACCTVLGWVAWSYLTLCDPMDSSLPGFSVFGISQARILEWLAISLPRGPSQRRDRTCVSCVSFTGSQVLYHCATVPVSTYWSTQLVTTVLLCRICFYILHL